MAQACNLQEGGEEGAREEERAEPDGGRIAPLRPVPVCIDMRVDTGTAAHPGTAV